ncbi:MAG: RNA polymerase sigma factor [Oscillospiraceae bacterium]
MDKDKILDIWLEYEPYIRKLCNYKLKSMPDYIDDCVQDVFLALNETIKRGIVITNIKSWLFTVANNKIKDFYKQRKSDNKIVSLDNNNIGEKLLTCDPFSDFDFSVSDAQLEQIESSIIKQLTDKEIKLLIDKYRNKLSVEQIAQNNKTSVDAIYKRLSRLKIKVKFLIREELDEHFAQKQQF